MSTSWEPPSADSLRILKKDIPAPLAWACPAAGRGVVPQLKQLGALLQGELQLLLELTGTVALELDLAPYPFDLLLLPLRTPGERRVLLLTGDVPSPSSSWL